jgi:hypothetical protein
MKRFAMLAGIALAVGIGSAAMACEDGIYAADETTMTTPQQACATGNCTVPKPTAQSADSRCPSNSCPVSAPQRPTYSGLSTKPTLQLACGSSRSCGCCW